MVNLFFLRVLVVLALLLSFGCTTMPVFERNTESKMILIQEKIEDGQKSGVLTPDQYKIYLAALKDIETEYAGFGSKSISRGERDSLHGRLDVLENVVNKALAPPRKAAEPKESFWDSIGQDLGIIARTEKIKPPTNGERIIKTQKRIEDGINGGNMTLEQGSEFQARMDYIRTTYLRMMEGGRIPDEGEKEVISRLLDSLNDDLNHLPKL